MSVVGGRLTQSLGHRQSTHVMVTFTVPGHKAIQQNRSSLLYVSTA